MLRARPVRDIECGIRIHTRFGGYETAMNRPQIRIGSYELREIRLHARTPGRRGHEGGTLERQQRKTELHEVVKGFERSRWRDEPVRTNQPQRIDDDCGIAEPVEE